MSLQDPISDMITRIRNAQAVRHPVVSFPHSVNKASILALMEQEGYIQGFEVQGDGPKKTIDVALKYYQGRPVIAGIKRVSRPGLRKYMGAKELPKVQGGLGISVVSTSQGVMSDRKARSLGLGGEVLFEIT